MTKKIFLFLSLFLVPVYLLYAQVAISKATESQKDALKYKDFELRVVSSTKTIKISDLVGKSVILLNFWTTWCPYCVKEVPELLDLNKKYKQQGLTIVAVNIAEPESRVVNFIKSNAINYDVVLDQQGTIARSYGVRGIPMNFLIDPLGNIVFANHSLPDDKILKENIEKLNKMKENKDERPKRRTKKN